MTQKQACEDVMNLLNRFKDALLDIAEEQGITRIQLMALYCVGSHGELPMGKMADDLHCDPSNVTGLVDRLVHQELLIRQECSTDRRTKNLRLTAKGERIVSTIYELLPSRLGCDKLTSDELHTLHQLIVKVTA